MGLDVLLEAIPQLVTGHPNAFFLLAGGEGELTGRAREAMARVAAAREGSHRCSSR